MSCEPQRPGRAAVEVVGGATPEADIVRSARQMLHAQELGWTQHTQLSSYPRVTPNFPRKMI